MPEHFQQQRKTSTTSKASRSTEHMVKTLLFKRENRSEQEHATSKESERGRREGERVEQGGKEGDTDRQVTGASPTSRDETLAAAAAAAGGQERARRLRNEQ